MSSRTSPTLSQKAPGGGRKVGSGAAGTRRRWEEPSAVGGALKESSGGLGKSGSGRWGTVSFHSGSAVANLSDCFMPDFFSYL